MASALHWPVGSRRRVSCATRSDSAASLARYWDSRYFVAMRLVSGSALFILGLGFFMLHNTLQVRATHMAPEAPGAALSLFAATFFLAQAAGALIGGWSFDHLGAGVSCSASAAILVGLGFAMGWIADKQEFDPARR